MQIGTKYSENSISKTNQSLFWTSILYYSKNRPLPNANCPLMPKEDAGRQARAFIEEHQEMDAELVLLHLKVLKNAKSKEKEEAVI